MARVGVAPPLGMFVRSVWIWLPRHIIKSLSQRGSGLSSSVSAGTKVKVVDTREKSESVAHFLWPQLTAAPFAHRQGLCTTLPVKCQKSSPTLCRWIRFPEGLGHWWTCELEGSFHECKNGYFRFGPGWIMHIYFGIIILIGVSLHNAIYGLV